MANEISPQDLITQFEIAIAGNWGYIYGTAGTKWTQSAQNQKVNYMENKYGSNWKTSSEAKKDKYYYSAMYGAKWIGHYVADCSGLFVWAYKKYGLSIAHASNSIYKSYCNVKGKLKAGVREDGKELLPGTAVFTGTENDHGHIGLYIGNGWVIEASGTQTGVIKSKVSLAKWTYFGELNAVNYGKEPSPAPIPEKDTATVTGKNVALRYGPTTSAGVITRIATGRTVKLDTPPSDWQYVTVDGKSGYMMKQFLKPNS